MGERRLVPTWGKSETSGKKGRRCGWLWFCLGSLLGSAGNSDAAAQILPDRSLPHSSSVEIRGGELAIGGGTTAGVNLFHSFEQFSILTGETAIFDHSPAIRNIISRVTGNSPSAIDGLLGTGGTANLFFLNPNGILFGPQAQLRVGGSFLATTASDIRFEDGTAFGTQNVGGSPPLLSVRQPIGLDFRAATPAPIVSQSRPGLQVAENKTLALIGGGVRLEGGNLTAPGGRIEIGAIAGGGRVDLVGSPSGDRPFALAYDSGNPFRDIELSRLAVVKASGNPHSGSRSGDIQLQGRNLSLREGAQVQSLNFSSQVGGSITLNASESIALLGNTDPDSPRDSTFALSGFLIPQKTSVTAVAFGTGRAGAIAIRTGQLRVTDGADITAATNGVGAGGNLTIVADRSVEIGGETRLLGLIPERIPFREPITRAFLINQSIVSQVSVRSGFRPGGGRGGNISIATGDLTLRDGATITAGSIGGDGGSVAIDASGTVAIYGSTEGSASVSNIATASIELSDASDITIRARQLSLRDGGALAASTFASGQGGSIRIAATDSVEVVGRTPDNRFQSIITTNSFGSGEAGLVEIETGQLSVSDGAAIAVSSLGTGSAGNLLLKANTASLVGGTLTAETEVSRATGSANISLQLSERLTLARDSLISATANRDANGGNINIDTPLLTVFPPTGSDGSDIIANAERGNGGNITINAQGIFGIAERQAIPGNQTNDIDASSQFGASGQVEINSTIDPNRGAVQLPETVVDPNALVAQNPCKRGSQSQFTRTGRGGLPPSLNEDLNGEATQVGLVEPAPNIAAEEQVQRDFSDIAPIQNPAATAGTESKSPIPNPIVPTQGWVFNDKGEVVLVAYDPTVTGPQRLRGNPASCPVP
jgi:filamentous hemagglutinin family protein